MANDKIYTAIIPPPVGGWNTRDPISNMAPEYALELENWFPGNGVVELRKGFTSAHTVNDAPLSMATYTATSGDQYLMLGGSYPIASYSRGSSETNISGAGTLNVGFIQYWQQFRTRMFMTTNYGADDVYVWTGTGNAVSAGFTIGGAAAANVGPITSYKSRLYFAHRNTAVGPSFAFAGGNLTIYYGGVDAVNGALTSFDLSSIFKLGGYISFIGTITRAKSFIEDSLFVIVSSNGEIVIYQGDNPGAVTWSILAQYFIPAPCGENSFFYFGSDLIIQTIQGAFSLSAIMGGDFGKQASIILSGDITNIIKSAITEAYTNLGSNPLVFAFQWGGITYPKSNMLILNIPNLDGTRYQYVMNSITGAWCKFTGLNALCFGLLNNNLYFSDGNNARLALFDNGYVDTNLATGATKSRTIKLRHAYNYFNNASQVKQFTEAQPIIYQSEGLDLTLDINVDYADVTATSRLTDTSDTAYKLYRPFMGLNGLGTAGSIRIDGTVTTKRASLQATKVFWNEGGVK